MTDADRKFATLRDEQDCYEKLIAFCGGSLVGRVSKETGLSADHRYDVEQFSTRLLWPSRDTAAASLFVRLSVKDTHQSSAGPRQVSATLLILLQQHEHLPPGIDFRKDLQTGVSTISADKDRGQAEASRVRRSKLASHWKHRVGLASRRSGARAQVRGLDDPRHEIQEVAMSRRLAICLSCDKRWLPEALIEAGWIANEGEGKSLFIWIRLRLSMALTGMGLIRALLTLRSCESC